MHPSIEKLGAHLDKVCKGQTRNLIHVKARTMSGISGKQSDNIHAESSGTPGTATFIFNFTNLFEGRIIHFLYIF